MMIMGGWVATIPELPVKTGLGKVIWETARAADEFGSFLDDLASTVAGAVEDNEDPWSAAIRDTIDSAERQGFTAARLEALQGGPEPADWEIEVFDEPV